MSDPAGQFEWMDRVLTSASMAKEKVPTLKLSCSPKFLRVLFSVIVGSAPIALNPYCRRIVECECVLAVHALLTKHLWWVM